MWEARRAVFTGVIRFGVSLPAAVFERALDRALAGPLTDAVGRSLADHRVIERIVASPEVRARRPACACSGSG